MGLFCLGCIVWVWIGNKEGMRLPAGWVVMSVVGARPIVAQELCEYYNGSEGLYCSIKPGITGLWQVEGRSDIEDYDERVKMDREYILHRNMWLDIKIVFKTVWKVLQREGAY